MSNYVLPFEKPILELEKKLDELRGFSEEQEIDMGSEVGKIEQKIADTKQKIYSGMTPWQKVQMARHPQRPYTRDYIDLLTTGFRELHGDRLYRDDRAIIGGTAVFRGTVSLENNGGFASVRSGPAEFDMEGYAGIRLRVHGDGNDYRLRLRTTDSFDGVAYQQTFGTTAGKWITIDIPFADFTASFRGRRVPDAPALNPSNIRQIGFLIADRQTGPFALEIASISVYTAAD